METVLKDNEQDRANIILDNSESLWPTDILKFTPLMRQFLEIKYSYDLDIVLLFRVGDFYETFFEDAKIISKELELTLTGRTDSGFEDGRIPMAGVPAKAIVNYVSRLLEKGFKVAICDQMEDPALAKGIVKRQVTKLLTPGTLLETDWLPVAKNNYIASVYKDKKNNLYGLAYADVSCGEFYFTEINLDELINELGRINPSEILVSYSLEKSSNRFTKDKILNIDASIKSNWSFTAFESEFFSKPYALKRIQEELKIKSINSLGVDENNFGLIAAGSILAYIDKTQLTEKASFVKITNYAVSQYLSIDKTTRKNLELTESAKDKSYIGSLMWAIDYTKTQMGKRRLRSWIEQPLLNTEHINYRFDTIDELIKNKSIFYELSQILERIYDLERISSRLSASAVNARELVSLKRSLQEIPSLSSKLKNFKSSFFKTIIQYPKEIIEIVNLVESSIVEEPPIAITEGNLIKSDYNSEIKSLRELVENGDSWLQSYTEIEKERTGIKNLKVNFNRTFGFYIEISKGNLTLVPEDYVCKQTMVNGSRFITPELKDYEKKALHADQRIKSLEYDIFCEIREKIKDYTNVVREIAFNISNLDAILSLSQAAVINNYKRPVLDDSGIIEIKASRHPVVEKKVGFNNFVSNDTYLEAGFTKDSKQQLIILTGPNMAGKSTYMRQIALITVLAQMGSYVPCDYAKIGVVDQIFTRVGASDDIAEGQSTFMVEMVETSAILNKMTERSLILLDEVGRGTSTYDGVAIAWALAEYLVKEKQARTVFATHFHELNGLSDLYKPISNYQVTVKEENGEVIFLRKVIPGGADKSYGIEVAKMAGLPKPLLTRANQIMKLMNDKSKSPVKINNIKSEIESGQLSLFKYE